MSTENITGITHKCCLCSKLAEHKPVPVWKLFNPRSEWMQLTSACTEPQRRILTDNMKGTVHNSNLLFGQNQPDTLVSEMA